MQSYKALSPIKIDTSEDAILLMHEQEPPMSNWSYDLMNPGKNFWYNCILCGCKHHNNGRLDASLCPKCWVFIQGYYWFAPTCYKERPNPCEFNVADFFHKENEFAE